MKVILSLLAMAFAALFAVGIVWAAVNRVSAGEHVTWIKVFAWLVGCVLAFAISAASLAEEEA